MSELLVTNHNRHAAPSETKGESLDGMPPHQTHEQNYKHTSLHMAADSPVTVKTPSEGSAHCNKASELQTRFDAVAVNVGGCASCG